MSSHKNKQKDKYFNAIYPTASEDTGTHASSNTVSAGRFDTLAPTVLGKFDTLAPTVSVNTVACPLDDALREEIQKELTRHFKEKIASCCQRVKNLVDAIEECLILNDGWMWMEGDILYFSKINAVMPRDLRQVPQYTFNWSRMDGTITEHLTQGEVPRISSSVSVGSLPGVIPTRRELEKILTSRQIQNFQNSRFNEKRKETHLQNGIGGFIKAIVNSAATVVKAPFSNNTEYFAFFEKKFSTGQSSYDNSNISFEFGKHENYQEVLKQTFEGTYLNQEKSTRLKNILGKMTGNWLHDTTEYPHGSIGFEDIQSDELLSYLNYFYYTSSYDHVYFYSFKKQVEIYNDLDVHDVAKDLKITWHALPICRLHNGGPLAREEMNRRGIAMLAIWSIFQLMPESIYTNRELNEMANSVNERIKALKLEGQSISDPENLYKLSPSEYTPILGGHGFIANELIKPLLDEFKVVSGWIRENPEVFNPDCDSFLDSEECLRRYENGETVLGMNKMKASDDIIGGDSSDLAQELLDYAAKSLLECDYIRGNIQPKYPASYLTDPKRGVWDLWGVNAVQPGENGALGFQCQFIARNPAKDIHEAGLIAIDFGTKSTIVVRHDDGEADRPMRIGENDLTKLKFSYSAYENPTVMQLRDIRQFLKAYRAREGRPFTRWDDMLISHDAEDAWKSCENGKEWTQFLAELKQWAGSNGTCRVMDSKGYEMELPPYLQIGDSDFDPLEIYAYLLGLQINNMNENHGIYLRYEMSYPVKYDKPTLDRLHRSFERGIRKSLPKSILADDKLMKRFVISMKTSEPAAYALCALQEFKFDPHGEERIFYGVFDFGGGTTDFDYGIYREGNEEEQEANYFYVLEHFKPSGDKDLGGEKLLQLMAYDVLKSNKAILMNGGKAPEGNANGAMPSPIVFSRPYEKDHTSFAGDEVLVDDNLGWANINLQRVMEELRPLWEESNHVSEQSDEPQRDQMSSMMVTLYDRDGELHTNIKLECDAGHLRELLKNRIEQGVVAFFEQLAHAYRSVRKTYSGIEKVHIFLAGNSCKSPLVHELFERTMKEYTGKIQGKMPDDFFELYPPLGTPEAEEKQKERGINLAELPEEERYRRPSGKTGVAFGLVIGRSGGDVKIQDGNLKEDGISFRFHVGRSKRGLFESKLDSETPKNKWVEVMSVGERVVIELKYTDSAQAFSGELPANKAKTVTLSVPQPEKMDCKVFVRATSATAIEVAIAKSEAEIGQDIEKYELE